MTVYYVSPSEAYLESVANFISKNYQGKFENLLIILPDYNTCRYLQEMLIEHLSDGKGIILPRILTYKEPFFDFYENISLKNQINIFKECNSFEQHLELTNIVLQYEKFNFTLVQAAEIAKNLAKLFADMTLNQINLDKLQELYDPDSAEHSLIIKEFLQYAHQDFEDYLAKEKKISHATKLKYFLEYNLDYLKANQDITAIIVGLELENLCLKNFIKAATKLVNVDFILPKYIIGVNNSNILDIAEIYDFNKDSLKKLSFHEQTLREKLLNNIFFSLKPIKLDIKLLKDISLITVNNQIEETCLIAVIIKYIKIYEPFSRIAIVTYNNSLVERVKIFLQRFNIELSNTVSKSIADSPLLGLIKLLFQMVNNDFEPVKVISFLKHPLILNNHVFDIEKNVLRKTNKELGYNSILKTLEKNNKEAAQWFVNLINILSPLIEYKSKRNTTLKELIKLTVNILENLKNDIWQENQAIAEVLRTILWQNKDIVCSLEDFPTFLTEIISSSESNEIDSWNPQIFALHPEKVSLTPSFDHVIIADMNDNVWPAKDKLDPWLSDNMRTKLGLSNKFDQLKKDFNIFYNLLHTERVYITRSNKTSSIETSPSIFILKLLAALDLSSNRGALESEIDWHHIIDKILTSDISAPTKNACGYPRLKDIPTKISVTYIELLMRNPYGFYAKKILKLDKLDNIGEELLQKDFGIFLHEVIDKSCGETLKKPNCTIDERLSILLETAELILKSNNYNKLVISLWWPKFLKIATEFALLEHEKSRLIVDIHSEIEGEYKLKLQDGDILITAKADRIEVLKNNQINIIDFKTGTVPNISDIKKALSPQLLIEYLIASNKGYKHLNFTPQTINLSYVKFGARKPYIKQVLLELEEDLHINTREGLKNLLEFFFKEGAYFLHCPNKNISPNYNDYKHLSREKL